MIEQQLRLLQYPEHLDRCYDDPNPYAYEHQVPVTWQILYAGELALESASGDVAEQGVVNRGDRLAVDVDKRLAFAKNVDNHTPIIAKTPQLSDVSTARPHSTEVDTPIIPNVIELHPLAEVIEFPNQ